MQAVLISSKYQIVIPRDIRQRLHLVPGEKLFMVPYAERLELIPEKTLKTMRGILEGIDTNIEREEDDRL